MRRLFENGFAEKVVGDQINNRVRYLPHFGVQNVNKPGRVRLVFDAAAKTSGQSFNDLFLPGPQLLKSLLGVFMRFRQFFYAFKSDLKDMFLKIVIRKEDRDVQRFLWRTDSTKPPEEYRMKSMLFGANSSPCTALFTKNKNASLFSSVYPAAVKSVEKNFYMDDYLESCATIEEASERVKHVIEINANAGWEMHSWASNDESVVIGVKNTKKSTDLLKADAIQHGGEKVLGLR